MYSCNTAIKSELLSLINGCIGALMAADQQPTIFRFFCFPLHMKAMLLSPFLLVMIDKIESLPNQGKFTVLMQMQVCGEIYTPKF